MHLNVMSPNICSAEKLLRAFLTRKISGFQMFSSFMCFKLTFQRKFLLTIVTLKCFSTMHENVMSCKSLFITKYFVAYVTFDLLFDSKVNGLDMSAQIFFPWKPFVTVLTFNVTLSVEFRLVFFKCFLPFKSQDTDCAMPWSIDYWQPIHGGYLKILLGFRAVLKTNLKLWRPNPSFWSKD